MPPPRRALRLRTLGVAVAAWLFLSTANGCLGSAPEGWNVFSKAKAPPPVGPVDSLVLRGDKLEQDVRGQDSPAAQELAGAKRLYQEGKYDQARPIFAGIAANTKNPILIAEEACYYEADCLRLEGYYPGAGDTYNKLLTMFPSSRFKSLAHRHMFDIANYWLDATRQEMKEYKEQQEGKRWLVLPASFINIDKTKPLTDMEGHALRYLEQIHITDPGGPLGDQALFLVGGVAFFREDYPAADHCFSELVNKYKRSTFASEAVELSIVCKQMSTGGAEYDHRKLAEARELVNTAQIAFPKLAAERKDFLTNQIVSITAQQAEKDYQFAEFYRRTGHPASAYFYYEIVRRRYPGTSFAQKATDHMTELRGELDRNQPSTPVVTQPPVNREPVMPVMRSATTPVMPGTPVAPGMMGGRQ